MALAKPKRDRDTEPKSESKVVKWIETNKPWSPLGTMEPLRRRNTAVISNNINKHAARKNGSKQVCIQKRQPTEKTLSNEGEKSEVKARTRTSAASRAQSRGKMLSQISYLHGSPFNPVN
ncbi:hypothetical protein HID58_075477, partial [Brassica napus]